MAEETHEIVLVRHGETEWSRAGKHTGRTDIGLTEVGRQQAQVVGAELQKRRFAAVWTSPLSRAADTCRLAGFGDVAVPRDELMEWDYGEYEGRTTAEIRRERPGWTLWRDGVLRGETIDEVGARVDRVLAEAESVDGDVISSRTAMCCVCWQRGGSTSSPKRRLFALDPATLSVLGYERETRVVRLWNEAADG